MTFKERFLRGDCNIEVIHDWVALWHAWVKDGRSLQKFLGLTDTEYEAYCGGGIEGLANAMDAQVYYRALYLSWDELCDQLQALVRQALGPDHSIDIKRVDYYYWEMRLLNLPDNLDEKMSNKLCEQLELQEIEPDHFTYSDSADSNQMLRLLGKLTGYEVSSSHADDNGVWIICKEHRASGREYVQNGRCQPEVALPSDKSIQKALQCLFDNGIAADETETVLQALGYILFDAEIV